MPSGRLCPVSHSWPEALLQHCGLESHCLLCRLNDRGNIRFSSAIHSAAYEEQRHANPTNSEGAKDEYLTRVVAGDKIAR